MAARPGLMTRPSSVMAQKKTVVLVTGGNAGIGREIVASLCQLPNYQVLMGCRDTSKGEAAASAMGAPINVNPIQLDITDDESIEHCYLTIEQMFGKLDILVNNAGVAGMQMDKSTSIRQLYQHIYDVNVISTAAFTDKMTPLLEKSQLPKIIFVGSGIGSIERMVNRTDNSLLQYASSGPYGSSKSALNYITAFLAKVHPKWKVNVVCPGFRATNLNGAELNENTDPKLGAVRVTELAQEGPDGVTGTYSNSEGPLPW